MLLITLWEPPTATRNRGGQGSGSGGVYSGAYRTCTTDYSILEVLRSGSIALALGIHQPVSAKLRSIDSNYDRSIDTDCLALHIDE